MARKKVKKVVPSYVCHQCNVEVVGEPYQKMIYSNRLMCSSDCVDRYFNYQNLSPEERIEKVKRRKVIESIKSK